MSISHLQPIPDESRSAFEQEAKPFHSTSYTQTRLLWLRMREVSDYGAMVLLSEAWRASRERGERRMTA